MAFAFSSASVKINNENNVWVHGDTQIAFNMHVDFSKGIEIDFPNDKSHELSSDDFKVEYPYRFNLTRRESKGKMIFTATLSANVKRDLGRFGHTVVLERLTRFTISRLR